MKAHFSRRGFIRTGMLAAAGVSFLPPSLLAAVKKKDITVGVQLYSFWEGMFHAPRETLEKVAAIGFSNVEHSGYAEGGFYGYEASEFKNILEALGLKMPGGESLLIETYWDAGRKEFNDYWKKLVDDSAEAGQKFIFSPWLEEHLGPKKSDVLYYVEMFNACGELCRNKGMEFGYCNDDFEFTTKIEGESLYDIIMENLDPDLVAHQLDLGKVHQAGAEATEILKRYPERFTALRVKDVIPYSEEGEVKYESIELGDGEIALKKTLRKFRKKGETGYLMVAQDSFRGQQPERSMERNYKTLKKWGYR